MDFLIHVFHFIWLCFLSTLCVRVGMLAYQELTGFFCKRPDSERFRLCGHMDSGGLWQLFSSAVVA